MLVHEKVERPAARMRLAVAAHALRLAADRVVRSTVTLHDQPVLRCQCARSPCRLEIKTSGKYTRLYPTLNYEKSRRWQQNLT